MAFHFNPKIATEGLLMHLDAGNPRSHGKFSGSLINDSTWTIGTGGCTGYSQNGATEQQNRKISTGPFGTPLVVWECVADAPSSSDGGWNTSSYSIDNTYTYRFSCWIRRTVQGNGTAYLGTNGFGSVDGVNYRSNGTLTTNPYFNTTSTSSILADWTLWVGHVWPAGSGTGSNHVDTGMYRVGTGYYGSIAYDFVWLPETTSARHRSYLYYSTDTATRQEMCLPRIDKCDGTEPTIQDLLDNNPHRWRDLSGNNNHAKPYGNQTMRTHSGGVFTYTPSGSPSVPAVDADGSWWQVPHTASLNPGSMAGWTISGWAKQTADQNDNGTGWFHKGDQRIHAEHRNGDFRVPTSTSWTSHNVSVGSYHGSWVHYTVTYNQTSGVYGTNPGETKVYINGILDSTVASNTPTVDSGQDIVLGRRYGHEYRMFSGSVANYMFYNRALTPEEVFNNYCVTKKRFQ